MVDNDIKYKDRLKRFVQENSDAINSCDASKVEELFDKLKQYLADFKKFDESNLREVTAFYTAISFISNQWLKHGFNPLTGMRSVPKLFTHYIDEDKLTIPSNIYSINSSAFGGVDFDEIIISDGVQEIETNAFNCCSIKHLIIKSKNLHIKRDAFSYVNIKQLEIPKTITYETWPEDDSTNDIEAVVWTD